MNNILRLLIITLVIFSLNACKNEPCNNEHTGSISITNNTNKNLIFIVKAKDIEVQNTGDYEVTINKNENFLWEDLPSGETEILVFNNSTGWVKIESLTIDDCDNPAFTYFEDCDLYGTASAYVNNNLNVNLMVAVKANGVISNTLTLSKGESHNFIVKKGELIFLAKFKQNEPWQESETYSIKACEYFSFDWNTK